MNDNLTYRFDEIMTAVALAGDSVFKGSEVTLPNLTRDLHEPELFGAIMCQTFKQPSEAETDEFAAKLAHLILNSVITKNDSPSDVDVDDIYGISLSVHLAWATGNGFLLFNALGMLGALCSATDTDIPEIATLIFRGNKTAHKFANLDPYKILKGEYDLKTMMMTTRPEVPEQEVDDIIRSIEENRGKDVD